MQFKSYLIEEDLDKVQKNNFLFYGENIGLKDEFRKKIKNTYKNSEILIFNQEEILKDQNIFLSKVNNLSLFEKKKVFIVNQANDKFLPFLEILGNVDENQKFFIFADILEKKSKIRNYYDKSKDCAIVACYMDNEISIKKIIHNRLKGFQGLTAQNINLILDNCNLDREKVNNELDKIISYFQNKKLDTEKLEVLLNTKINDDFNLLKDEALMGNKTKTNTLLCNTVIDLDKFIFYLNLINQRLTKLKEINKLSVNSNLEEALKTLKPQIFWKDKPNILAQLKKWDEQKINSILSNTYDIEKKVKTNSKINSNVLLKKLILDICQMANA